MSLPIFFLVLFVVLVLAAGAAWLWGDRCSQIARTYEREVQTGLLKELAATGQRIVDFEQRMQREREEHQEFVATLRGDVECQRQHMAASELSLRASLGELEMHKERVVTLSDLLNTERTRARALESAVNDERETVSALKERVTQQEVYLESSKEKLNFLDDARAKLGEQMKLIANDILVQSGQQLTAQQQEKLATTLAPFKEALGSFAHKVEESEKERSKEQGRLGSQLDQLMKASLALDKGAQDLARALMGDNKVSGDWGEGVLERVLEAAGLHEGREFDTQQTERDEEGKCLRPDVVIRLPEQGCLVVDSKVSLSSWVDFANDCTEDNWGRVVTSVRAHIQLLGKKNYQELYGLTSIDFVLMFIPTECTFLELARREPTLLHDAWSRRVMLVGPGNLQWALRMVRTIWKFEDQNKNAKEIAAQAARMYDKLAGFVDELEKVGAHLNKAVNAYNGARKRLDRGRDNVLSKARKLKELGVSPKHSLPDEAVLADYADGVPLLPEPELASGPYAIDTETMDSTGSEG